MGVGTLFSLILMIASSFSFAEEFKFEEVFRGEAPEMRSVRTINNIEIVQPEPEIIPEGEVGPPTLEEFQKPAFRPYRPNIKFIANIGYSPLANAPHDQLHRYVSVGFYLLYDDNLVLLADGFHSRVEGNSNLPMTRAFRVSDIRGVLRRNGLSDVVLSQTQDLSLHVSLAPHSGNWDDFDGFFNQELKVWLSHEAVEDDAINRLKRQELDLVEQIRQTRRTAFQNYLEPYTKGNPARHFSSEGLWSVSEIFYYEGDRFQEHPLRFVSGFVNFRVGSDFYIDVSDMENPEIWGFAQLMDANRLASATQTSFQSSPLLIRLADALDRTSPGRTHQSEDGSDGDYGWVRDEIHRRVRDRMEAQAVANAYHIHLNIYPSTEAYIWKNVADASSTQMKTTVQYGPLIREETTQGDVGVEIKVLDRFDRQERPEAEIN